MDTLHGIDDLERWRGATFVPTMGALHQGHCALIRQGLTFEAPVVVSIFVNEHQFAPGEDFDTYPRTLDADLSAACDAGASAVFLPSADLVYPPGAAAQFSPLPRVATMPGLEDACRPRFFPGVCLVVARLFDLVRPARAVFGEKDWQQLKVIEAMVQRDTKRFPMDIVGCPTSRECDGLALSSRNAYLDAQQRVRATALWRALELAKSANGADEAEQAMVSCLQAADLCVEYAVVRDAETLGDPDVMRPLRALIAARLDSLRLIDNAQFSATHQFH
jgi:pantoate--beta-alanine ligase